MRVQVSVDAIRGVVRAFAVAGCVIGAACVPDAGAPGGIDADQLPQLSLTEDLRIGSIEDPDKGFSRIGAVEVAKAGQILVLETQERRVRVYDDGGNLLRTIGGSGQGPGEFRNPSWLGVRGDTMWVGDMGNARLTLFLLDGSLLATVPSSGVSLSIAGVNASVIPDAPLGAGLYSSRLRLLSDGTSGWDSARVPAFIFDSTGAVADTVGAHFIAGSTPRQVVVQSPYTAIMPEPLHDWTIRAAVGTDSIAVTRHAPTSADEAVFTVTRTVPAGDTIYHTRVRYRPQPVNHDSVIAASLRRNANVPLPRDAVESKLRTGLPSQRYHPPVVRHRVGADGSLWLQREDLGADSVAWLIVTAAGSPSGVVRLPRHQRLMWISATAAWLVEPDELDVPWLVRRRVEPF